jgi:ABC-type uncharacterized transport system substrate-binding protein
MRRRDFIKVVAVSAAAWPVAAHAQSNGMRRIGVIRSLAESDPLTIRYVQELRVGLEKLGWIADRNIQPTYRYIAGDPNLVRAYVKELVGMQPDVIVGHTTPVAAALSQATHTIPVVFVSSIRYGMALLQAWRIPAAT